MNCNGIVEGQILMELKKKSGMKNVLKVGARLSRLLEAAAEPELCKVQTPPPRLEGPNRGAYFPEPRIINYDCRNNYNSRYWLCI
jgi:hypothetical protein